jgi:hypothetical protein
VKSDTITRRARNTRRKHARELLAEHTNEWGGSSDLDELAGSKYAVVWKNDDCAWVLRAADAQDLAAHYLDAAYGPDSRDYEWIEAVIDLDTGEDVPLTRTLTVTLTMPNGVQATRTL